MIIKWIPSTPDPEAGDTRIVYRFVLWLTLPDRHGIEITRILERAPILQRYDINTFSGYAQWVPIRWADDPLLGYDDTVDHPQDETLETLQLENLNDGVLTSSVLEEVEQDVLDDNLATFITKLCELHGNVKCENPNVDTDKIEEDLDSLWEKLTEREHMIIQKVSNKLTGSSW